MAVGPQVRVDLITGEKGRGQFADLLDRAFSVPPGRTFFDDFPVWDERILAGGDEIIRIGAFSGTAQERLVACAGVRMARLSAPLAECPVALVGAVATAEDWRGQGLASRLVSLGVKWAESRGAVSVFLWGSEHSLYRKVGFELCGTQVMVPLNQLKLPPEKIAKSAESGLPEALREGWVPGIFDLMMGRAGGLALREWDRHWMEAHQSVQWLWTGDPERPSAYVGIGRGLDLQGVIHEWGGDSDCLLGLLRTLRNHSPDLLLLGSPDLLKRQGISQGGAPLEFLCMARVLDPERLVRAFYPQPASLFPASSDQKDLPLQSEMNLARLLFGQAVEIAAPSQEAQIVPLWFWGLDAV